MITTNDKVVCINPWVWCADADKLEADKVYVVRGVLESKGKRGLYLVGVCGGWWTRRRFFGLMIESGEVAYDVRRFRKLSEVQAENAARHAESALHNTPSETRRGQRPDQNP